MSSEWMWGVLSFVLRCVPCCLFVYTYYSCYEDTLSCDVQCTHPLSFLPFVTCLTTSSNDERRAGQANDSFTRLFWTDLAPYTNTASLCIFHIEPRNSIPTPQGMGTFFSQCTDNIRLWFLESGSRRMSYHRIQRWFYSSEHDIGGRYVPHMPLLRLILEQVPTRPWP